MTIKNLKDKILAGGDITPEEAYALADVAADNRAELWAASQEITKNLCPREFDSCSIINARSGKCPENCKLCAQSAHHKTKVEVYPLISNPDNTHCP